MKYFTILFLSLSLIGCNLIDKPEKVPALIKISSIDLETDYATQGSNSNVSIVDAWVYVNDEFLGIFDLPATVPALYEGEYTVKVYAGIKRNGISGKRVKYPFYSAFTQKVKLEPNKTVELNPIVRYNNEANVWFEDFETAAIKLYNNNSDTDIIGTTIDVREGSYSGIVEFQSDDTFFEIKTDETFIDELTSNKSVYLEMDYSCNHEMRVNIEYKKPSNFTQAYTKAAYLVVNPTDSLEVKWKKLYVDVSEIIQPNAPYEELNIVIGALRQTDDYNPKFLFDNVKVVTQ